MGNIVRESRTRIIGWKNQRDLQKSYRHRQGRVVISSEENIGITVNIEDGYKCMNKTSKFVAAVIIAVAAVAVIAVFISFVEMQRKKDQFRKVASHHVQIIMYTFTATLF